MNNSSSKMHPGQFPAVKMTPAPDIPDKKLPASPSQEIEAVSLLGMNAKSVQRLVVLVPNEQVDEVGIAREIWSLSVSPKMEVLLISLSPGRTQEYQIQRRLITLAAFIRNPWINVETRVVHGRRWQRALKPILKEGDVILCHVEQRVGWRQQPLADMLGRLDVPVWTLSGLLPRRIEMRRHWLVNVTFWTGALGILAFFFYLQTRLDILQDGLTRNVFLILTVVVEISLLDQWNSFFS